MLLRKGLVCPERQVAHRAPRGVGNEERIDAVGTAPTSPAVPPPSAGKNRRGTSGVTGSATSCQPPAGSPAPAPAPASDAGCQVFKSSETSRRYSKPLAAASVRRWKTTVGVPFCVVMLAAKRPAGRDPAASGSLPSASSVRLFQPSPSASAPPPATAPRAPAASIACTVRL